MRNKEMLRHLETIALTAIGLWAVSFMAFTKKQRDAIALDRDEGECLAPFPHNCNKDKSIEVHHVLPQRYGQRVGLDEESIDVPENAVSLCSQAHDVIHPDRVQARRNYHHDKEQGEDSFKKLGEERKEKLDKRQIYWNDEYDRPLRAIAMRQTQEAKKRGWEFPGRRKKKEVLVFKAPEKLEAAGD